MNFKELCKQLEAKIQQSYEQGTTMEEAEKLAGEFLSAQMAVSEELKAKDLDSRMRKSGLKAVRASAYLEIVQKADKKPTETQIDSMINTDSLVSQEQDGYDKAEVEKEALERYYNIFREAHIFYRGVSKGRFE